MYAKDIAIVRTIDINEDQAIEAILSNMPTPEEI